MMRQRKDNETLRAELLEMLAPKFPGIEAEVGHSDRWDRMCVTFTWAGFADLLPEERFHRLVAVLPEQFREARLAGFVWLELASGETVDGFLKLPRSDDVEEKEAAIYAGLVGADFFGSLAESLGPAPDKKCPGDFSMSVALLTDKGFSPDQIRDAKLVFIRHGAYCDCQGVLAAQHALAECHAGAA